MSSRLEQNAAIVRALRQIQAGEYKGLEASSCSEEALLECCVHFGRDSPHTANLVSLLERKWESKWDEIGASSLKSAFRDTQMIDAAWLATLAQSGSAIPRCQDVPAEAKVSLKEMEAWGGDYTVGALIVS